MRYAVDWGNGNKLVIMVESKSGKPVRVKWDGDFESWIRTLKPGDVVLIEPMFEPYRHSVKNRIIDYCESNNISLLTISSRETFNERKNKGIEAKSEEDPMDIEDAKVIFGFLIAGKKHFGKARRVPERTLTWSDEVNMDRRNDWKDSIKLYSYLPKKVPQEHVEALTNNGKYSDGFVLPIVRAAIEVKKNGNKRDLFDHYVGAYGGGRPSYLRATFYRRVRTLDQRSLGVRSFKKNGIKIVVDHPELHKENMKKLRKATRWIFYQVQV